MVAEIQNMVVDARPCTERIVQQPPERQEVETVSAPNRGDSLELSPFASAVRAFGLLPTSSLLSTNESLRFDLSYQSTRTERVDASGWYSREEATLSLNLSYSMTRSILIDGVMQQRQFQINVQIEAKKLNEAGLRPFQETEDIVHFLRRVVDEIFNISKDDSKFLQGVFFDMKDYADLAGMEKGRVLKMISQFIQMVQYMAQLRQMTKNEGGDDLESVVVHPTREVTSGVQGSVRQEQSLDIHISIQETSSTSSENTSADEAPAKAA
jgi:hypothetical protein